MTSFPPNQQPQPAAPYSTFAIVAFILCLIPITFPLGAILAIVHLTTARRTGGRGTNLAFAGLGVGLIIAVVVVLVSTGIVFPWQDRPQRRMQCAANLRGLANVFKIYQSENNDYFPALPQGKKLDCSDMDVTDGIDTQNGIWLLVASRKASPEVFICPNDKGAVAFNGVPDVNSPFPLVDDSGNPSSAGRKRSYSYSYQVPNGSVGNPAVANANWTRFAIMSDRAPFNADLELPPAGLADADAARKWLADNRDKADRINSPNHAGKGQNVLFQDGHVKWQPDPWCGINGDNIFTRASGNTEKDRVIGVKCGVNQLPFSDDDSVLLNIDKGVYCKAP